MIRLCERRTDVNCYDARSPKDCAAAMATSSRRKRSTSLLSSCRQLNSQRLHADADPAQAPPCGQHTGHLLVMGPAQSCAPNSSNFVLALQLPSCRLAALQVPAHPTRS